MFEMCDVFDVRCLGCGILPSMGCLGLVIFWDWDDQDARCSRCGMLDMQVVGIVRCPGCEIFGIWDVGCLGC